MLSVPSYQSSSSEQYLWHKSLGSGNQRELDLIEHFSRNEARMNDEISSRKSCITVADFQENIYKVDVTGATISSASSISLLHQYCSKLPRDEYDLILNFTWYFCFFFLITIYSVLCYLLVAFAFGTYIFMVLHDLFSFCFACFVGISAPSRSSSTLMT